MLTQLFRHCLVTLALLAVVLQPWYATAAACSQPEPAQSRVGSDAAEAHCHGETELAASAANTTGDCCDGGDCRMTHCYSGGALVLHAQPWQAFAMTSVSASPYRRSLPTPTIAPTLRPPIAR